MKPRTIKIGTKPLKSNRSSIYLDYGKAIYLNPKSGKLVRKEYLQRFYYDKPKNASEKLHNKETQVYVEKVRNIRQNEIDKPEIYSGYEQEQLKIKELGELCFVEYFKNLADKRKNSTHDNWVSCYNYLKIFTNGSLKFADLNEKFLEDFKEFLLTTKSNKSKKATLSQNSASSYFNKIKATLKQAFKEGILQTNLNAKVEPIKEKETRREFVTIEELNALVKTPCNNPLLKRVALFSALTGMAFKEIQNMVWSDISYDKNRGYTVLSKRQKTQRDNYIPISEQAYGFTQGKENPKEMPQDKRVFEGLKYSAYHNKHLYQWIGNAGITKDITFHCFRHTYAIIQLKEGTDIYTVSKMLGHKSLKTTQIYAKVVDEAKRKTVDKIKLNLDDYED